MSGGGGGGNDWRPRPVVIPSNGGGGAEGAEGGTPNPCDISEITNLNSPNRTVISTLRIGDILDIVFQSGPPQRLVAQQTLGAIAGSITSPSMMQIIQCITIHQIDYVAEVVGIRGAVCQVKVRVK